MYVVYQFFTGSQEEYHYTCADRYTALVFLTLYYDYYQIVE